MGCPFFGLTSQNSIEEIEFVVFAYKMSHWDVYNMPVNVRRWYIRKYSKRIEEEQKASGNKGIDEPLSPQEKARMIANSQNNQYRASMKK